LLHAPSDTLFLTSDNPVAVHDPGLRIRAGALEYSRDASFTFPVSRLYALQGVLRPGGDGQENLRAYDVRSINKMIIERSYRYVYAPFRCDYISRIQEKSYAQHPERFPTIKQN